MPGIVSLQFLPVGIFWVSLRAELSIAKLLFIFLFFRFLKEVLTRPVLFGVVRLSSAADMQSACLFNILLVFHLLAGIVFVKIVAVWVTLFGFVMMSMGTGP